VPELSPIAASVVTCVADADAIDRLAGATSGTVARIAPDEALIVSTAGSAPLAAAVEAVTAVDPDAIVLETTDGWAMWALEGENADEMFARVSRWPLPEGVGLGEVAGVPATVVAERGRIAVLVPAMWRDAVRERLLADGASLGITERAEPRPWATGAAR
jgi:hypothetical protein